MQPARLPALLVLVSAACCLAQTPSPKADIAPPSSPTIKRYTLLAEPTLSQDAKLKLLRQKIKYVFVLFQENRSFDLLIKLTSKTPAKPHVKRLSS
jgi:phospholipase C